MNKLIDLINLKTDQETIDALNQEVVKYPIEIATNINNELTQRKIWDRMGFSRWKQRQLKRIDNYFKQKLEELKRNKKINTNLS